MEEFSGVDIPDAQDPVEATSNGEFPVRGDIAGVHKRGSLRQSPNFAAVLLDYFHHIITGRHDGLRANAEKVHRSDFLVKSTERLFLFPVNEVPDFHRLVCPHAGEHASVPLPTHAEHMAGVPFQGANFLPPVRLKDSGEPIGPAGGQLAAIR